MADYERYGEYNTSDEGTEEGPPPSPVIKVLVRIIKWVCILLMVFVCALLAIRMTCTGYYPDEMEELYYTDALKSYAAKHELKAETQEIRVPFEREVLEISEEDALKKGDAYDGFYYADNLIVVRDAGVLQCSLRLNKSAIEDICEAYAIPEFEFNKDAFDIKLVYRNPETEEQRVYVPSMIFCDTNGFYNYMKVCFDGVNFEGVSWLRLEITPRGADPANVENRRAICVYENHEYNSRFDPYDD